MSGFLSDPRLSAQEARRAAGAKSADPFLAQGISLATPDAYPETLRNAEPCPPALWYWGDWNASARPMVAMVGTRGASAYGKAVARKFAEAFARSGVTVVSGGALGIDAAAHKGALEGGGQTIAVLGGGVDNVYPAVHGGLFRTMRESGCIVSQFALGSKPTPYRFLVRNQLIAALSWATVVIEAPMRSGALRTAHAANDLGRQVFVVPANIDNLNFAGSHALIRDGASLVDHPDQVLEALDLKAAPQPVLFTPESEEARQVLSVLTTDPLTPEKIAELTGLSAAAVLSELTILEVEGAALRDSRGFIACL